LCIALPLGPAHKVITSPPSFERRVLRIATNKEPTPISHLHHPHFDNLLSKTTSHRAVITPIRTSTQFTHLSPHSILFTTTTKTALQPYHQFTVSPFIAPRDCSSKKQRHKTTKKPISTPDFQSQFPLLRKRHKNATHMHAPNPPTETNKTTTRQIRTTLPDDKKKQDSKVPSLLGSLTFSPTKFILLSRSPKTDQQRRPNTSDLISSRVPTGVGTGTEARPGQARQGND